jgi:branched-chain amino acid transport system substrate-binding protein
MRKNQTIIGLLLPESGVYPRLGEHLLAGLRLALARAPWPGPTPEIIPRHTGHGQSLAEAQARHLLAAGARLVIGVMNSSLAAQLRQIFVERHAFLLVTGVAAAIPRRDEANPFVFHNALPLWQACLALGAWAAASLGRRALIVQSFYESGYDPAAAFQIGFESGGGVATLASLTHLPPVPLDFAPLFARIAATPPDVVYAGYSGANAAEFTRAWAASPCAGRIPLVGHAFLAEGAGCTLPDARIAAPWLADAPAWQDFVTASVAATGEPPDVFSALGYEAGLLLALAARAAGGDLADFMAVGRALAFARFDGPRGPVIMDPPTQHTLGPLHLCTLRASAHVAPPAPLALPDDWKARIRPIAQQPRSGWVNAYLCV